MRISPATRYKRNGLYADLFRIKKALADTAYDVQDHTFGALKDKSTKVRDNIVDYTTTSPFKSLGMALLIGLVVGFLFRK